MQETDVQGIFWKPGKTSNFDLSILPYKFGLIFMGMKQKKRKIIQKKKFKIADSKKVSFSKSPILNIFV